MTAARIVDKPAGELTDFQLGVLRALANGGYICVSGLGGSVHFYLTQNRTQSRSEIGGRAYARLRDHGLIQLRQTDKDARRAFRLPITIFDISATGRDFIQTLCPAS